MVMRIIICINRSVVFCLVGFCKYCSHIKRSFSLHGVISEFPQRLAEKDNKCIMMMKICLYKIAQCLLQTPMQITDLSIFIPRCLFQDSALRTGSPDGGETSCSLGKHHHYTWHGLSSESKVVDFMFLTQRSYKKEPKGNVRLLGIQNMGSGVKQLYLDF